MKLKEQFKREYRIWKAMRARCNAPCYKNSTYQQKEIKVCERWNSFINFMEDMGPCPEGCSIDRIDNNGNYEKDNCHWATAIEQTKNRGDFNIKFTYNGETLCLKDWAIRKGIKPSSLYARYKRHPELSIEELLNFKDPRSEKLLWEEEYYTRDELCEKYNIPKMNFYDRIHKGWSLERTLLTPVKK